VSMIQALKDCVPTSIAKMQSMIQAKTISVSITYFLLIE
jgi:hypothetical protein